MAGSFRVAQALTPEERERRRAERRKRRAAGGNDNGARNRAERQQRRETRGSGNRAARQQRQQRPAAPAAQPPARPARPAQRATRPPAARPPAAPPPAARARQARPPRPTPPPATAAAPPAPPPAKRKKRRGLRKLERNVRKFFKKAIRRERRATEQRAARREELRRYRDLPPPRVRRRFDERRFDDRRIDNRRWDAGPGPHLWERRAAPSGRTWRRDSFAPRDPVIRRMEVRERRQYRRIRRHIVRRNRHRNRFYRGRSIYYLPPAGVALAASLYALDSSRASYDDYYRTFMAPPVRRVERHYSLDDVVADPEIRGFVRSVNIDTITFYSGSARLQPSQLYKLEDLADAIHATLRRRPDEVFLIAGHTDAVGAFDDNLLLSERRAGAVQRALIEEFDVPPENLEAVGYGEQYLRIDTDAPDRRNRRVVVRAIGALLARR